MGAKLSTWPKLLTQPKLFTQPKLLTRPKLKRWFSLIAILLVVSACTSKEEQLQKAVDQQINATTSALVKLEKAISSGKIRNTAILSQYADQVANQRPEMALLAKQIATDAGLTGPIYSNLVTRLNEVKTNPAAFVDTNERLDELQAITDGASLSLFNDALSDPINVLADLSDNTLPRINAISRESEISANQSTAEPGSQMVGNPNYGNWQTGSNGTSFWAWYGMYSMFSNVMGYNRPSYGNWGRNRGYSYYSDYGRSRYSSPKQRSKQQTLYNKTKKSFASKGKRFTGPYSKRRVGSSSLSRASHTPSKKSAYSKRSSAKSSYSSGSGSGGVRSGSSRTSRGSRGGGK
jgi:hypothetical protein